MKELKAIMQSKEIGDDRTFINTVKEVISSCLLEDLNVDDLPMYIIDYIFVMLRSKSISDLVEAQYICHSINDEGVECGNKFKVGIPLSQTYVKFPPGYNVKCIISLGDDIGLKLKAPSFSKFRSIGLSGKGLFEITDQYIYACIDCIYDHEKILLPLKDFQLNELEEFIETFPAETVQKISEFLRNQPTVSLNMKLTCPKCKNESEIELNGLDDFFV